MGAVFYCKSSKRNNLPLITAHPNLLADSFSLMKVYVEKATYKRDPLAGMINAEAKSFIACMLPKCPVIVTRKSVQVINASV